MGDSALTLKDTEQPVVIIEFLSLWLWFPYLFTFVVFLVGSYFSFS